MFNLMEEIKILLTLDKLKLIIESNKIKLLSKELKTFFFYHINIFWLL